MQMQANIALIVYVISLLVCCLHSLDARSRHIMHDTLCNLKVPMTRKFLLYNEKEYLKL